MGRQGEIDELPVPSFEALLAEIDSLEDSDDKTLKPKRGDFAFREPSSKTADAEKLEILPPLERRSIFANDFLEQILSIDTHLEEPI